MTTSEEMLQASAVQALPRRERVGLVIDSTNANTAIKAIIAAENAGVRQIWTTQGPTSTDALTTFAAAAIQTSTIRLGTAIIPTYPRHPLTLATQVRALETIAPGRLRLGIGPSHRPTIEGIYGIEMGKPLAHIREYVSILRSALWEGNVDHHGHFYNVAAKLSTQTPVPILISTLSPGAFKVAGEISDGALTWLCPVPYLLQIALPALQEAARQAQRPAPPLVAHVLVAASTDRQAVITATRQSTGNYGKLPFYANMFAESGHPVTADGTMSDDLIESMVISGNAETITARLNELLSSGLDELLVLPIPVKDPAQEQDQLAHIIGQL